MAKGVKGIDVLGAAQDADGKATLTRFVSMLSKLGQRNREAGADSGHHGSFDDDGCSDNDNDNDNEQNCATLDESFRIECWIPRR
jgi:hypothetical protein